MKFSLPSARFLKNSNVILQCPLLGDAAWSWKESYHFPSSSKEQIFTIRWTGFLPSLWNPNRAEVSEVLDFNLNFALKYSSFGKLHWKKNLFISSRNENLITRLQTWKSLFSSWASRGRFYEEAFIWKRLCSSCYSFKSFNCKSLYKNTHVNDIHLTQVWFYLTCIFTDQDSCTGKRKLSSEISCTAMQWNQGVYLKPDVWQHQPCQLPHLSPSEMQYPGASGFWISPIEEQDINVKFTQTAPHAHSHHAPVAYGAVFPSSQLFWRIIPEKYFPALARMKEHYLCSGFSSLSQAGFTWCLSLTTAVQWAASRKDFSTVVPSPLCLMLSPSYSHSYSLGPSWQPNYLIFTTTYYF